MRILLDLQGAQTGSRFRGIGRYSLALAQAIARNAAEHEVWILLNNQLDQAVEDVANALKGLLPRKRIIVFDVLSQVSWENADNAWRRNAAELIRESFIAELKPDIVHISSLFEGANLCNAVISIGGLKSRIPVAVTLYDLIPLLDPVNYLGVNWVKNWYSDKVENLKRADLLLSISAYSRQEAISALDIDADKIVNISTAHTQNFQPCVLNSEDKFKFLSSFGITAPYIMYNGALESRKNLDRLLQAFSLLPFEIRNEYLLVFVGKVSDFDRLRLEQLAKSIGIDEKFVLTGHVSDSDLVSLFTHCTLFVFPSLHEGFGLPALEAMACGAPTIGSNVTSIPEVIGRSDALFNPLDPNDISEKILKALTDDVYRQSLKVHALIQAEKFSWDICGKNAIAAFEEVHKNYSHSLKSSWSDINQARMREYRQLIDSISKISRFPIAPSEVDLVATANCIAANRHLTDCVARAIDLPDRITWRIEGPFDSSYSLALLNRETARALDALGHHVVLHSTEGPGDFLPNQDYLRENPDLAKLYLRSQTSLSADADVTSRNLYPPRVEDMNCRMNLLHGYAWEETAFPSEWVNSFNMSLQGLTLISEHVKKIMIDNGVTVPLSVIGCGANHWEDIKADQNYLLKAKTFRFLHVSSCFPRKGADILLQAYGKLFTDKDDVTLVIKTFPNPHNEIHNWLDNARAGYSSFPDVLIIEEDLADSELKSLYRQCHAMVAPSRAEGFGLPMAEAMISELAVIVTGWSGQLDFCNEDTAWLVDFTFEPAKTHLKLFDSVWAEPDVDHLAKIMRRVFDATPEERNKKIANGKKLVFEKFRWVDVAKRLVNGVRSWSKFSLPVQPRVGWVTTWNTRCGIATYSSHLVEHVPAAVTIFAANNNQLTQLDNVNVVRCWDAGEFDLLDNLASKVAQHHIDALIVQFNYSFFQLNYLDDFLIAQLDAGRIVVVVLHSTLDPVHVNPGKQLKTLINSLSRCHRILVHSVVDLNRMKKLGLVDNVALFPHGIRDSSQHLNAADKSSSAFKQNSFAIASYGFFLPHKGLLELIDAVAYLRSNGKDVTLHMINSEYPVSESSDLISKAKARIISLDLVGHVKLTTDFLADDLSLSLLAEADLIVFPYQNTGESASGAVRYGLATGLPVAVTPLDIFNDVFSATHILPGCSSIDIAKGIESLIDDIHIDSENVRSKKIEAERWRAAHKYEYLGNRLYSMLQALSQ